MLLIKEFSLQHRVGPISGTFKAGCLTLLIGPNGSGKSSLLSGAAGLAMSDSVGLSASEGSGTVSLDGACLSTLSIAELARYRAMLAQDTVLPHGLLGYELLALGAEPVGGVSEAVCLTLARLAEPLGLNSLYQRQVNTLSGGEQQRLLIASTLLQVDPSVNPDGKLLLLDEPLAGLDWQHQLATLRLLREYAALGLTVVASIHDLNLACQYADEIWCLHQGKLVAQGAPEVVTPELIAQVFSVTVRLIEQEGYRLLLAE
ncbi:vitamin B12 ABC transporter ATP-binding protein BtuD [Oceanisphaera sp. W20_SRM_FM3]|uniref:vitamin B12 ABC transporter ATP-binding protein BtuD n=1 Tax=Oceanisphaera sp. W20_SRM_FM3 TaxID=3240267 RepID=UPI003F9A92B2